MKVNILGSSSRGNCYVFTAKNGDILILEAGVNAKKIGEAINFAWHKVIGCIVTHEHGDHAGHVSELHKYGVYVFATDGTAEALQDNKIIIASQDGCFRLGDFVIRTFPTIHDAAEPIGLVMQHPEFGAMLFATDTGALDITFKNLNNVFIECNYDADNSALNNEPPAHLQRVRLNHLSLQKVKDFIERNDLAKVDNFILLHISERHGNAQMFEDEIKTLIPDKTVKAARPGMQIDLLTQKRKF